MDFVQLQQNFDFLLRSKEKLRELQFEIAQENGVALVVEADVTDAAAVQNLLDTTLKAFPKGVDVLVNNAAYVAPIHRSSWGHNLKARQGIKLCPGLSRETLQNGRK